MRIYKDRIYYRKVKRDHWPAINGVFVYTKPKEVNFKDLLDKFSDMAPRIFKKMVEMTEIHNDKIKNHHHSILKFYFDDDKLKFTEDTYSKNFMPTYCDPLKVNFHWTN